MELDEQDVEVDVVCGTQAEMDEMWSFVHDKSQQYWLWWAIDHNTGTPLALCFGTREHKYLDELKELIEDFNITTIFTDGNPAYEELMTEYDHVVGKRETQKIERKHLSLRTWCSRLVCKGIRFSKTTSCTSLLFLLSSITGFLDGCLPNNKVQTLPKICLSI